MDRAELLRTLGDPTRLRILAFLGREELSVTELVELCGLSQSTVSGHLAALRRVGLVLARRDGAHSRYLVATPDGEGPLVQLLLETPLPEADHYALERLRAARAPAPGGLGPDYLPGRSWEALARLLLALLPPLDVADLGVGTGQLTRLLARSARRLVAVDRDPEALRDLPAPIEPRVGNIEVPPLEPGAFDLVVWSQSLHCVEEPTAALAACLPALRPGGRVAILDLAPHQHEWVRHRLGHRHLGFPDLGGLLSGAGFVDVHVEVAHRDRRAPAFTTLLGTGRRPGLDQ